MAFNLSLSATTVLISVHPDVLPRCHVYSYCLLHIFSSLFSNKLTCFATYSMYSYRDGPELKRDENGQVAEVRLPSKLSTAMSFLTVIGSVFLGVSMGGTFSQLIGNRFLIRETWMVSV